MPYRLRSHCLQEPRHDPDRDLGIVDGDGLGRVMADPVLAAHEQHGHWGDLRDSDGIVTGARDEVLINAALGLGEVVVGTNLWHRAAGHRTGTG